MGKVICPSCGYIIDRGNFCSECGAALSGIKLQAAPEAGSAAKSSSLFTVGLFPAEESKTPENTSVSDEGLELLVHTCSRTAGSAGGNGYREYVLYKRDEENYELHYYSKYEYMPNEIHLAYRSCKAVAGKVFRRIEELGADSFENYHGDGTMGTVHILKYKKGGRIITITDDNLPFARQGMIQLIEAVITETEKDENRLD